MAVGSVARELLSVRTIEDYTSVGGPRLMLRSCSELRESQLQIGGAAAAAWQRLRTHQADCGVFLGAPGCGRHVRC
jgi:hypothetical protein